ncbi:MAG: hypothetical protein QNJ02_05560 [Desulfobacterales bacterium]|nr:hypothetical protein [Desulfobacterales bacterium]
MPPIDRELTTIMKALGSLTIILLVAGIAQAAPEIEGRWKSDKAASMTFNQQYAILSAQQANYISQMLGNMTVEFEDGNAKLTMPAIRIQKDGKVTEYAGFEEKGRYVIMGEDEDTIVLKLHGADGAATLMVYHFVSEDQMWVYVPSASESIDLHIREYFTRVK